MRAGIFLIFTAILGLTSTTALALNPELLKKEEGWFWYKDPKEKVKKPEPPPVAPPTPEEPKKEAVKPPPLMSVKWLQKNLDELKEKAIDDPTDDNVSNYLYAQRVMMDKADQFSRKAIEVATSDPLLDERNRYPVANAAMSYLQSSSGQARQTAVKELSKKGGLWFFFDTSCRFCVIQKATLDNLIKEAGFTVFNVSMDGKGLPGMSSFVTDRGQYQDFGLKLLPAVVYAVPPNTFVVLSQGALSTEDIKTRLLAHGKKLSLIPKELEREIFMMDKGLLTTDDMQHLEEKGVNPEDPGSWVKYLREQLGGRYK